MTTATQLAALIAVRSHDSGYREGPTAAVADYISFLNDAVDDWNGSNGLLRLSDASTLQVDDTYDYAIPATFQYLYEVLMEIETGKYEKIDPDFWYVDFRTGATPTVHIRRAWFAMVGWTLAPTLHIMMAGQGHQVYFTGAETVPAEMVAYLRERGIYHALEYLSQGVSSLAASRRVAAGAALQLSADMEQKRAMSSRVRSGSIYIPGR